MVCLGIVFQNISIAHLGLGTVLKPNQAFIPVKEAKIQPY